MVSSRHRSSIAAAAAAAASATTSEADKSVSTQASSTASTTATSNSSSATASTASTPKETSSASRIQKAPLDSWTTREKLFLASLALKHNNSWNSVARHMQAFLEKDRPENWSNQKTCAAQFERMMNELGVDKRPKRNEPSDASGSVIYKKMTEKRIVELEENLAELRKQWLQVSDDLKAIEEEVQAKEVKLEEPTSGKQKATRQSTSASKTPAKTTTTNTSNDPEKVPTRAFTRRESSRQNLEKTFAQLHHEALGVKLFNKLCKPPLEVEKTLGSYDKAVLKHVDLATIKKSFVGDIEDPYALMNDFLLMFQNATMYYPTDHPVYQVAVELRDRYVPQWEKQIVERYKPKV